MVLRHTSCNTIVASIATGVAHHKSEMSYAVHPSCMEIKLVDGNIFGASDNVFVAVFQHRASIPTDVLESKFCTQW